MVRETIVLMLEDNYEIHSAGSVRAAIAQLRTTQPSGIDLILLDCLLPDGNPAEVLAEADQRSIPVVLISGDLNQAAAMTPARRFLPKPFTQASLLEILDTARG